MQVIQGVQYFAPPEIYSLRDMLSRSVRLYADRPAVRFRKHPADEVVETRTYRELNEDVRALQQSLLELGLGSARIGVVGENSYHWMVSYLATINGVGVIVPLDRMLPPEEMINLAKRSRISALIYDASFHDGLYALKAEVPHLKYWIRMQEQRLAKDSDREALTALKDEPMNPEKAETGELRRFMRIDDLFAPGAERLRNGNCLPLYDKAPDELAALVFTSGTSANSKGVMLTHKSLSADVRALFSVVKFKDPLNTLSILPLHHTFENTCGFLCILTIGGCIHVCDGLRYIAKNLNEYGVDMIIGVPTVFDMFYKRIMATVEKEGKAKKLKMGIRISRILRFFGIDKRRTLFKDILAGLGGNLYMCIGGAAAMDPVVLRFFRDIGVEILQGYGMTETSPVSAGCNTQVSVIGTVGQALGGVTIAIDNDVPYEPGEILVKSDINMIGYYEDEEETKATLDEDGWIHTGDIGRIDRKSKCLILTGRKKSMIVLRSGKKIFPEELERLLNQNNFVKDSLVFGQEDGNGDIILTAKIVLDEQALRESENISASNPEALRATLERTIDSINLQLPTFKGIRSYMYSFQDMVKTTTLKVRRGVEISELQNLIVRSKLSWKELSGRDLDQLKADLQKQKDTIAELNADGTGVGRAKGSEASPANSESNAHENMQESLKEAIRIEREMSELKLSILARAKRTERHVLRLDIAQRKAEIKKNYAAQRKSILSERNSKIETLKTLIGK